MSAALRPVTVTIYARVNESEVLNEVGSILADVEMTPITDENRRPGDSYQARLRVEDFNLAAALRTLADELERGHG